MRIEIIELSCVEFLIWFLEDHPDNHTIELDVSESEGVTLEDLFCLGMMQWSTECEGSILDINGKQVRLTDRNMNEPVPFGLYEKLPSYAAPYCSFEYLVNRIKYAEIALGIFNQIQDSQKMSYWRNRIYETKNDLEEKLTQTKCDDIMTMITHLETGRESILKEQAQLWGVIFFDSLKFALERHREDSVQELLSKAKAMLIEIVPEKKYLTRDSVFLSYPFNNLD
ncbi:MAG: hypothetical protein ACERJ1_05330 [Halodesulfovibrio sp.]|uniref:hypothetical protein n=1 Tax=Halodesulfovibrio sp. TaxID=1912772 RepID=UPI00359DE43E